MTDKEKQELLGELGIRERILKGQLQFYVRYHNQVPEGKGYADKRINECLDELRELWELKKSINK